MTTPKVTLEFEPFNVHHMSGWAPLNAGDKSTPETIILVDGATSRTIYVVEEFSAYDWMTGGNVVRTKVNVLAIDPRSDAKIVVDWKPEPELPF